MNLTYPKQEHQKSQYNYQITLHFRLPTKPFYHLNNFQRKQEKLTYSQDSQKSRLSVNKMAENGYTTIFHEGNKSVTIHKSGTLTITTSETPVLRGSKPTGSNLWTVLTDGDKPKCEEANNVYDLPLTKETIRYLHASAGHPVKDTWTKAITQEILQRGQGYQ